ncbi:MAG TPA: response regulator [Thiolapillus brandeum]|uniref:Response regulator n=1 Tax=Thiolapillus brandeum TaxID=1076588 RepID=A0A831NY39_9GAMM|nr:response regulator [Thiolapillus brandeum]
MKALLVDDSKAARFAMGKLLKDQGLEVETAASGEEALDKIATEAIDIVFMDQSMPGMGGIAATTAITSNEKTKHIPVVLCTGNEGDKLEQMAEEAGAIGVLTKPPQEDKLKTVLATIKVETAAEEVAEEQPTEEAPVPVVDMDAIMKEVDILLEGLQEHITNIEQNMEEQFAALAQASDEKLQPLHASLKQMDERIVSEIKEQISMDAGNQRIQLEALRQQIETALDDIKEQEEKLRVNIISQVDAKLAGLVDARLNELQDNVSNSQGKMESRLETMQAKISGLQNSLLGKAAAIAVIAAGAAFALAYFLLK